ncbi:hypothetical protein [Enhygromyxa salina]|nr:hypothetical protein [Enhygromyxa salina]
MDEAIREAMGAEVRAELFGPSLTELYEQRVAALDELGRADLLVTCAKPCRIYINETAIPPDQTPNVPLGSYRVWVEDPTGELPRKREVVELTEADEVYEVTFAPVVLPPSSSRPPSASPRIMPRGAEITLLVIGAGLTATGAVLAATNDTKVGPMIAGALSLAVGAGLGTCGAITLTIDERARRRGAAHQATLTWTMQF